MKHSYSLLVAASTYAWMTLFGTSTFAAQAPSVTTKAPKATGEIVFFNSKQEKMCSLTIPETKAIFDFSKDDQSCTNNMAHSFMLQNVSSATLIEFHQTESCSNAEVKDNFFVKLKTTRQPTDWSSTNAPTMTFNDFKKVVPGQLIPYRDTRVESQWEGADYANRDWNEGISCVYIESSQPVN